MSGAWYSAGSPCSSAQLEADVRDGGWVAIDPEARVPRTGQSITRNVGAGNRHTGHDLRRILKRYAQRLVQAAVGRIDVDALLVRRAVAERLWPLDVELEPRDGPNVERPTRLRLFASNRTRAHDDRGHELLQLGPDLGGRKRR